MTNWNPLNNYWKREMRYRAITGLIMLAIGLLIAMLIGGCKKPEDVKPEKRTYIEISVASLGLPPTKCLHVTYTDSNLVEQTIVNCPGQYLYFGKVAAYKSGKIYLSAFYEDSTTIDLSIYTAKKQGNSFLVTSENAHITGKGKQTLSYVIP